MTTPSFGQLSDPTQSGPGFPAQPWANRLLTIWSMLATGQNPDGTPAPGPAFIVAEGACSMRPAAGSVPAGYLYYCTDTNVLYFSDGTSTWTAIGGTISYKSLTGPGVNATPGALTQAGGFFVNDTAGDGITINETGGATILIESTSGISLGNLSGSFGLNIVDNTASGMTLTQNSSGGINLVGHGLGGIHLTESTAGHIALTANGTGGVSLTDNGTGGIGITAASSGGITMLAGNSGLTSPTGVSITEAGAGAGTGVTIQSNLRSVDIEAGAKLSLNANQLSFFSATGTGKPTITGSKGGNAALASLLTALAGFGLIVDSTT